MELKGKPYILFHIPHASLKLPKIFSTICIKDKNYIEKTNLFLSDYLTDQLIPKSYPKLIFKYSRIFCDVEKFKEDKKEEMAKKGMGVIYSRDCEDEITKPNKKYRRKVLKSYYLKHHNKLDKKVTEILKKQNKCILIDFHSFSDEMVYKLFSITVSPDICIGIDENYTNEQLKRITIEHFESFGFQVEINTPYKGTMIPNKYLNKKVKNLSSIMIEMNKRVYLNKKKDFDKMQECIKNYALKIQKEMGERRC